MPALEANDGFLTAPYWKFLWKRTVVNCKNFHGTSTYSLGKIFLGSIFVCTANSRIRGRFHWVPDFKEKQTSFEVSDLWWLLAWRCLCSNGRSTLCLTLSSSILFRPGVINFRHEKYKFLPDFRGKRVCTEELGPFSELSLTLVDAVTEDQPWLTPVGSFKLSAR